MLKAAPMVGDIGMHRQLAQMNIILYNWFSEGRRQYLHAQVSNLQPMVVAYMEELGTHGVIWGWIRQRNIVVKVLRREEA